MSEASSLSGDTGVEVDQWQTELIQNEVQPAVMDMAELDDETVECEAAVFTAKLFLHVVDGDWKQAEGLAAVLHSYFIENRSNRGETVYE